jgi:hypothetical protein
MRAAMTPARNLALVTVGALLLGALLLFSRTPPSAPAGDGTTAHVTWPRQAAAVYTFSLQERTELWLAPTGESAQAPMQGVVEVEGLLTVQPQEDGSQALRFARVDRARADVANMPIQPPEQLATTLASRTATAVFHADGRFAELRFEGTEEPLFENTMHVLVGLMQLSHRDGAATYDVDEDDSRGTLTQRYTVTGDGAGVQVKKDPQTVVVLNGYPARPATRVGGQTVATLDGAGLVDLNVNRDVLAVGESNTPLMRSRSSLVMQRTKDAAALLATVDTPRVRAAAQVPFSQQGREQALRQRAGDLNATTFQAALHNARLTGEVPNHGAFLWKATALMRLEPATVKLVEEMFQAETATHQGRGLAVDLLTFANTPESQEALLRTLRSPAFTTDERPRMLYQRLALVPSPTPEVLAYAAATYEKQDPAWADVAAHTLGSVVGKRVRMGDAASSDLLVPVAQRAAGQGNATVDAREASLAGLGNAGLERFSDVLLAAATDGEPRVRARALRAMRKLQTNPKAHQALMTATVDQDERVARTALQTLEDHGLQSQDLTALRDAVARRSVVEGAYASLVTALGTSSDTAAVDETLRLILAQPLKDNAIKGRVRTILERRVPAR